MSNLIIVSIISELTCSKNILYIILLNLCSEESAQQTRFGHQKRSLFRMSHHHTVKCVSSSTGSVATRSSKRKLNTTDVKQTNDQEQVLKDFGTNYGFCTC